MRSCFFRALILVPLLLTRFFLHAQQDSTLATGQGNLHRPPGENNISRVNRWILPGALILYGVITPHADGLTDLNEDLREEIRTEAAHRKWPVDNYLQFGPAVPVYALNLAGIKGKHDLTDRSLILLMSQVFMGVSVYSVKTLSHVRRPDGSGYNSFPSGHTAEAFADAEFLREEYSGQSVWYGAGGYLAAATVGYLRLYNNKHWLNDVVAGAGFGIASTRLAYLLYPAVSRYLGHHKRKNAVIMPFYQPGIAGLHLFCQL